MNEKSDLLEVAKLGIEAEAFSRSPIGRFLEAKAKAEESAAIAELVLADPEDAKANREIRNQIHVARMFLTWLHEAVSCGQQAYQQIKDMEDGV